MLTSYRGLLLLYLTYFPNPTRDFSILNYTHTKSGTHPVNLPLDRNKKLVSLYTLHYDEEVDRYEFTDPGNPSKKFVAVLKIMPKSGCIPAVFIDEDYQNLGWSRHLLKFALQKRLETIGNGVENFVWCTSYNSKFSLIKGIKTKKIHDVNPNCHYYEYSG